MGFESQEAAERWAESAEFRADQLKEERMLEPERRRGWPFVREWSGWWARMDQVWTQAALREALELDALKKLSKRKLPSDQASALDMAIYHLTGMLAKTRHHVADQCAPWFDGSSFGDGERPE